jgi:SM-20-related protein
LEQSTFEELISSFLAKRVGISTDFLSNDLTVQLKASLITRYKNEEMKLAGVGNLHLLNVDTDTRRDKIFWLDQLNDNPVEHIFFDLIDAFVLYLNRTCFAGIKSYEFHYALYEKGAFYKKHIDQFKLDDSRSFSMILYLNEAWKEGDGGELKVYHKAEIQLISPENRKCVFFKSNELPHEVLLTNVTRMSITGWLKTAL